LNSSKDSTLSELDEKLELLIEMLKNRKSTLAKAVKHHYKKQEIFLMEAQKNTERRKQNLGKIKEKLQSLIASSAQNESKLERFEEEFININRSYDSPFHQFKNCTIGLNP
jgi:N12 class adenine-specific DNA methylase